MLELNGNSGGRAHFARGIQLSLVMIKCGGVSDHIELMGAFLLTEPAAHSHFMLLSAAITLDSRTDNQCW